MYYIYWFMSLYIICLCYVNTLSGYPKLPAAAASVLGQAPLHQDVMDRRRRHYYCYY